QAEDGIRDFHVTGVQTCALPICSELYQLRPTGIAFSVMPVNCGNGRSNCWSDVLAVFRPVPGSSPANGFGCVPVRLVPYCFNCRSEERRVGKECRSWWSA